MIVDLNALEFRQAIKLIEWCIANRIDYERANELKFAWYSTFKEDHIWELDIPEEYVTYWMLKWK